MNKYAGFIGLGHMGLPMAQNILKKDGKLIINNRSSGVYQAFQGGNVEIAANAREIAEKADVVFLSLPGPVQVAEIVGGADGLIANGTAGQIIVDLSTVSPKLNLELWEAAKEKGIAYIDVPVSGGPAGAEKGALSLMVGASEEEIEDLGVLPYLESIGNKIFYIGKRGGGSAIKLINNYMAFATQVINGEALAMADSLGLDTEIFYDVTTQSSGNSMILGGKMAKVKAGEYQPGFALDLVMKDLELARQLCQDNKVPNLTLNVAIQAYRLAQKQGYGAQDSSAVIKSIRDTYGNP